MAGSLHTTAELVLLRHGESAANADGRFAGRWDVPLTERGMVQSVRAADLLRVADAVPEVILTSPLRRAQDTAELVAERLALASHAVRVCPPLTERAYGALTGRRRTEVGRVFGPEVVHRWRRSLDATPPAGTDVPASSWNPADPLPEDARAAAELRESLADVIARVGPCQIRRLRPLLDAGCRVLVVGHGNSLRALVAVLDGLDAAEVEQLNIPTGQPLRYDLTGSTPAPRSGRYLDPAAAAADTRALIHEGGT